MQHTPVPATAMPSASWPWPPQPAHCRSGQARIGPGLRSGSGGSRTGLANSSSFPEVKQGPGATRAAPRPRKDYTKSKQWGKVEQGRSEVPSNEIGVSEQGDLRVLGPAQPRARRFLALTRLFKRIPTPSSAAGDFYTPSAGPVTAREGESREVIFRGRNNMQKDNLVSDFQFILRAQRYRRQERAILHLDVLTNVAASARNHLQQQGWVGPHRGEGLGLPPARMTGACLNFWRSSPTRGVR